MFRGNKRFRSDRVEMPNATAGSTFGDSVGSHFLLGSLDEAIVVATACESFLDSMNKPAATTRPDARAALRLRVRLANLEHALDEITCRPQDELIRQEAKKTISFYELMLKYSIEAWHSHLSREDIRIRGSQGSAVLETLSQLRSQLAASLNQVPA